MQWTFEQDHFRHVALVEAAADICSRHADGMWPNPQACKDISRHCKTLLSPISEFQFGHGCHDASKMGELERPYYEKAFHLFQQGRTQEALSVLGPALEHHYEANPHHPEYWMHGLQTMYPGYYVEMVCDWWAAAARGIEDWMTLSLPDLEKAHPGVDVERMLRRFLPDVPDEITQVHLSRVSRILDVISKNMK